MIPSTTTINRSVVGERCPPSISVIVPTYNRLPRLRRVLSGLRAQTLPADAFEVLVVSDGSTDGTDEALSSAGDPLPLVFLSQRNAGPAAARNLAVARASGELLLFLDDDVVPAPDLLAQHVAAHERLGPDWVVLGPMLTPPGVELSPWVSWEQRRLSEQYDAMVTGRWGATARQFYTGNASVPRSPVVAAGGFDTSFRRAEDVELAYRLAERGLRFAFVPDAVGHHYAERGYESWLGNAYAYGRNDVIFTRDKGHTWLLPVIAQEHSQQHRLLRRTTEVLVDAPWCARLVLALIRGVVRHVHRAGGNRAVERLLSVAYSVRYFQGVVDEASTTSSLRLRDALGSASGDAVSSGRTAPRHARGVLGLGRRQLRGRGSRRVVP